MPSCEWNCARSFTLYSTDGATPLVGPVRFIVDKFILFSFLHHKLLNLILEESEIFSPPLGGVNIFYKNNALQMDTDKSDLSAKVRNCDMKLAAIV